MSVDYSKLEKNMIDVLKEGQLKLGYNSEPVRLYYPLQSLNRFLKTNHSIAEMRSELRLFALSVEEKLGAVEISNINDRFCFLLSPRASDFAHNNMSGSEFISDFIKTVANHGGIDEVLAVFRKHSDHVHIERPSHGEFDYLIYFEDGNPDDFRYCITDEGGHVIYHRFTVDDYNDFHFEQD